MAALFISDLHLDETRPEITRLFFDFLAGPARKADALYILGDLFEAWIGDDDDVALATDTIDSLAELSAANVPLFVMHGNRDFLLGPSFAARTGATLLPDYHRTVLQGVPTLLMHGDLLCSDDVNYQVLRRRLRSPLFKLYWRFRSLPKRRALAASLRAKSMAATGEKSTAIMDVNQRTVEETMRAHRVTRLIHGHTHRPGIHSFSLDGAQAERIVLGDWYEHGAVLAVDSSGCRTEKLEPPV